MTDGVGGEFDVPLSVDGGRVMHVVEGNTAEMFKFEVVHVGDHVGVTLHHDGVDVLLSPHLVLFESDTDDVFEDVTHCW